MTRWTALCSAMAAPNVAFGRHLAMARDGRVRTWPDAVSCDGRYAWPYRNVTIVAAAPQRDLVDRAAAFHASDRWSLWDVSGADFSHGLLPGYRGTVMRLTQPVREPDAHPAALRIEEVRDTPGLRLLERTRLFSYEDSPHRDCGDEELLDERVFGRFRAWLGWLDDVPVATAALHLDGAGAILKLVSTLPQYRGRGYARALSLTALQSARNTDCWLEVTDAALPLYGSIGFEAMGTLQCWLPSVST